MDEEKKLKELEGAINQIREEQKRILQLLNNLTEQKGDVTPKKANCSEVVIDYLLKMKVTRSSIGFKYIVYAMELIYEKPDRLTQIIILYQKIGKKYDETNSNVERGMRNCIKSIWNNRGLSEKVILPCLDCSKQPKNSEFLGNLYEYVRRDLEH